MNLPKILLDENNVAYHITEPPAAVGSCLHLQVKNDRGRSFFARLYDGSQQKTIGSFYARLKQTCSKYQDILTDIVPLKPPLMGYIISLPEGSVLLADIKFPPKKRNIIAIMNALSLAEQLRSRNLAVCGRAEYAILCSERSAVVCAPDMLYETGEPVSPEQTPFLRSPEAASFRFADWQELSYSIAQAVCRGFAGIELFYPESVKAQYNRLVPDYEQEDIQDEFCFEFEDDAPEIPEPSIEPAQTQPDTDLLIEQAIIQKQIHWTMEAEPTPQTEIPFHRGKVFLNDELRGLIGKAANANTFSELRPDFSEWKAAISRYENELHFCPKCHIGFVPTGFLPQLHEHSCAYKKCPAYAEITQAVVLTVTECYSPKLSRMYNGCWDELTKLMKSEYSGECFADEQQLRAWANRKLCTRIVPTNSTDTKRIMCRDFFEEMPADRVLMHYRAGNHPHCLLIGIEENEYTQARLSSGEQATKTTGMNWFKLDAEKNDHVQMLILGTAHSAARMVKIEAEIFS